MGATQAMYNATGEPKERKRGPYERPGIMAARSASMASLQRRLLTRASTGAFCPTGSTTPTLCAAGTYADVEGEGTNLFMLTLIFILLPSSINE